MKETAFSLLAVVLALSGIAAEANQTTRTGDTGIAAMRRAAEARQYLFVFFSEKDDDTTRVARKTFDEALKKITPAPQSVVVDRGHLLAARRLWWGRGCAGSGRCGGQGNPRPQAGDFDSCNK
mgnify:CR=1 FL=1